MKRPWRWINRNPFFAALLLVVAVAVPGYVALQYTIGEAHEAANDAGDVADEAKTLAIQIEAIVAANEADRQARRAELCQRDVQDQLNDRSMWEFVLVDLGAFDPADPNVQTAIDELDRRLPRLMCDAENVPVPIED